ncbi:hypothetical protein PLANPX_3504 [Lacipirellula parvula]|uniref:Uncharacterized protein n=1 Tax=Lacipirellula parvula TaxID=2650471 RepID=A0A5K7XD41_9BACT|nr:hypothetical protein PLANPX_3504 [Lacipirellula parvula]
MNGAKSVVGVDAVIRFAALRRKRDDALMRGAARALSSGRFALIRRYSGEFCIRSP